MHEVGDRGAVWYGGAGHRLLSTDDGVECYRCGMSADDTAWQELIPDCEGPDSGERHIWTCGGAAANECAECGAREVN